MPPLPAAEHTTTFMPVPQASESPPSPSTSLLSSSSPYRLGAEEGKLPPLLQLAVSLSGSTRFLLAGTVVFSLGTLCSLASLARIVSTLALSNVAGPLPHRCTVEPFAERRLLGSVDANAVPPAVLWQPEMAGKVKEKTIWSYWYHETDCPDSKNCILPPVVQLCTESVWLNRGSFDYKIMHHDDIDRYISRTELPLGYSGLRKAVQKDALMNALLARYGGVALDITTVLLRPLDDYWNEMVAKGVTFRGYMYRLHGRPWGNSESTVVWFLMTRGNGIFTNAVRSQVLGMGDKLTPPEKNKDFPNFYHNPYFALGDQTLTPILRMINYSLPKCTDDKTVGPPVSWPDMCPEFEAPAWNDTMPGPARNDVRILLREPRDGPQLPYGFMDDFSMGLWGIRSDKVVDSQDAPACKTQQDCWKVFLSRYQAEPTEREAPVLSWVKLFNLGGRLMQQSRMDLLGNTESFFYNWLKLAGLEI
mmetsp:Transcript_3048/g.11811  ORF Transcript_3048/g.11811 Transcript_3048/m.11811 type:complete len:476 (+) Transcript_3048:111-1538(+)